MLAVNTTTCRGAAGLVGSKDRTHSSVRSMSSGERTGTARSMYLRATRELSRSDRDDDDDKEEEEEDDDAALKARSAARRVCVSFRAEPCWRGGERRNCLLVLLLAASHPDGP